MPGCARRPGKVVAEWASAPLSSVWPTLGWTNRLLRYAGWLRYASTWTADYPPGASMRSADRGATGRPRCWWTHWSCSSGWPRWCPRRAGRCSPTMASSPRVPAGDRRSSRRRRTARADAGGRSPRRWPWARLLRRVFAIDVLVCERRGSARRILGAVTDLPPCGGFSRRSA
jgi:hypothetical protein